MGPKLIGHTSKKGTLYSLRLLPIGGYCKMLGRMGRGRRGLLFFEIGATTRMAIVAAGPLMNFVLAFVILLFFCGIYGYTTTYVNEVEADYPAASAEAKSGDRFLTISRHRVHLFNKISYPQSEYQEGDAITAVVEKTGWDEKGLGSNRNMMGPRGGVPHGIFRQNQQEALRMCFRAGDRRAALLSGQDDQQ